jgi:hypothetical protein
VEVIRLYHLIHICRLDSRPGLAGKDHIQSICAARIDMKRLLVKRVWEVIHPLIGRIYHSRRRISSNTVSTMPSSRRSCGNHMLAMPPKAISQVDPTVTDAHCHSIDLDITDAEYDAVPLGGIASMGTTVNDQARVAALGRKRGWKTDALPASERAGPRVVSCFGESALCVEEQAVDKPNVTLYP